MAFLSRKHWGAKPPAREYNVVGFENRPGFEFHHTVTPAGASPVNSARSIQNAHLSRGWTDIFYNYLVHQNGTVLEGRPAHVACGVESNWNAEYPAFPITIALIGDYRTDGVTDAQKREIKRLLTHLQRDIGIGEREWSHSDRSATACPARVKELVDRGVFTPDPPRVFAPVVVETILEGYRGRLVRILQSALVIHGAQVATDGVFGPRTTRAVTEFKAQRGLPVDGVVGPRAWEHLLKNG